MQGRHKQGSELGLRDVEAPVYSRRRCTLGQRSAFFVMSEVPLPRAAAPAS
jgi:hypothetical protein